MSLLRFILSRRRARRRLHQPIQPAPTPPVRSPWFWAMLFGVLLAMVGGMIANLGRNQLHADRGQIIAQPFFARVPFRAVNEEATRTEKAKARQRQPAVYVPNTSYLDQVRDRLDSLLSLGTVDRMDQIKREDQIRLGLDPQGQALTELRRLHQDPNRLGQTLLRLLLTDFQKLAVLDTDQARRERDRDQLATKIVIKHPTLGELERYDNVIISLPDDLEMLRSRVDQMIQSLQFPQALWTPVSLALLEKPQPIYRLDADETLRREAEAERNEPIKERAFQANEVIVGAGRELTDDDLRFLQQEQLAYEAQLDPLQRWSQRTAILGLIGCISAGLWLYILAYNRRIAMIATRGLMLTTLILGCQLMAVAFTHIDPKFVLLTAAFPALLMAIVLAIAYDQRFAVAAGAVVTLVISLSLDLSVGQTLVILVGTGVAAALLDQVRTRSKLVMVGLWVGLAMAATALFTGLMERPLTAPNQWRAIRFDALLSLGTGIITGLFVQGILPGVESLFKVTTAMTLKELNDASHPLLRRLAQEAPGTYQHSLRLSDLAESAANAIGANDLWCKVGAMYHDIGKLTKPEYFVENQAGGPNRHDKLSPAMSLLIIVGHVKDGMELAREFNLPSMLRHFIESHHGTTLVEYFYHAARKQNEQQHLPAPDEIEFRYPGPKPQTREAAILMLGDCVEGAARAMNDPHPGRLEQLVRTMSNKRLMDGQFDQANLTLAELRKIENAMIKTLCAMYHGRIAYPSAANTNATPAKNGG